MHLRYASRASADISHSESAPALLSARNFSASPADMVFACSSALVMISRALFPCRSDIALKDAHRSATAAPDCDCAGDTETAKAIAEAADKPSESLRSDISGLTDVA